MNHCVSSIYRDTVSDIFVYYKQKTCSFTGDYKISVSAVAFERQTAPMLHMIDATKASPARCHYQVLTAALKGLKRKIDSILGDGNCLYRALAKELFGQEGGHAAIRHYISPFSAINKDTLVPFFPNPSMADWHLSKAAKEGFWGGTAETVAMASAFRYPYGPTANNLVTRRIHGSCSNLWPHKAESPSIPFHQPPEGYHIELLLSSNHYDKIVDMEGHTPRGNPPLQQRKAETIALNV